MHKRHHKTKKEGKNTVVVKQHSSARTGQGGNAFAINASDVGVVRTDVAPGR
ncbi:hypothetical protein N0M98_04295 [Paenibacillus doosanensis]|uniref:Uncharacterized protein n=1 Tax=Paenibacillus konkukensis TaxID=2020716 RepID=A0ABY4RZC5_9BACL|nr:MULTISPECIES: hypothetical protein [Paenibacillus]MCS7459351.1 hypothetical protein [Paenibacillus doosanensis]UQZ87145.1 hypothetical protein SK3146_06441 [Paenibacillus konkukensis]